MQCFQMEEEENQKKSGKQMENKIFEKPYCIRCLSKSVYTKIDGTIICKVCAYQNKGGKEVKEWKLK